MKGIHILGHVLAVPVVHPPSCIRGMSTDEDVTKAIRYQITERACAHRSHATCSTATMRGKVSADPRGVTALECFVRVV
jgi:hypothetical protein